MEYVILVDQNDQPIGTMEKLEAHEKGALHRDFSILVFNSSGDLMLQKRAAHKYHSGGLWTNTCCSHPRPGEALLAAAHRRLKEEMGFDCELKPLNHIIYQAAFSNGLIEHEFDYILIGYYDREPVINPEEADGWQWVSPAKLKSDLQLHPEKYTEWFKTGLTEHWDEIFAKK